MLWDGTGKIEGSLETILKLKELVTTTYLSFHKIKETEFSNSVENNHSSSVL